MPRETVYDPDWEPATARLQVRMTPAQHAALRALAAEFGVSVTWLVRAALAKGLPAVVRELRAAYAEGLRVASSRDRATPAVRGPAPAFMAPPVFVERRSSRRRRRRHGPAGK